MFSKEYADYYRTNDEFLENLAKVYRLLKSKKGVLVGRDKVEKTVDKIERDKASTSRISDDEKREKKMGELTDEERRQRDRISSMEYERQEIINESSSLLLDAYTRHMANTKEILTKEMYMVCCL